MKFKDHFSHHAGDYARFRPRYPAELFVHLASLAPARQRAWDCATGNGQAAIALADHFAEVIATDASAKQIAAAEPHERVEYRVARAEDSELASNSVDLVTVAQALHWFDVAAFFAEATRVLRPGGVLAVWSYQHLAIVPEIDTPVMKFYRETTGPYWPPERAMVEAGYRGIDFPFEEESTPEFEMSANWNLRQLLGYLRTWSATQNFMAARGYDPLVSLGEELSECWPPAERRLVRWPLVTRFGRKPV